MALDISKVIRMTEDKRTHAEKNHDEAVARMDELGADQVRQMMTSGNWPQAWHQKDIEWLKDR